MDTSPSTPKWLIPLALAAAALSAFAWWLVHLEPDPEATAPGPATASSQPDAGETSTDAEVRPEPMGDRPVSQFPPAEKWSAGGLEGRLWTPQRRGTAWLIVAADADDDPELATALVRTLWSHRDIGVVVLSAPATPVDLDRQGQRAAAVVRLRAALDALTQDGRPAVLLGAGRAAEAALIVAADSRVLAVVALDPLASEAGFLDRSWQSAVSPKWSWLGGPARSAQAVDELARGLAHARTVTRGTASGLKWLSELDQRAQLAGFLQSALGPGR